MSDNAASTIQNFLSVSLSSSTPVKFMNFFQGLPIAHMGKVINVYPHSAVFEVHPEQARSVVDGVRISYANLPVTGLGNYAKMHSCPGSSKTLILRHLKPMVCQKVVLMVNVSRLHGEHRVVVMMNRSRLHAEHMSSSW